ncbi:MAG: tetratricopeptide repeat protein [Solirubrobacterales bacterium]
MIKPTLRLLGGCSFVCPDGKEVPVSGRMGPVLVAVCALEVNLTERGLRAILSEGAKVAPSTETLNMRRSRLPKLVKERFGEGASRWELSGVQIDLDELRSGALDLLDRGLDADRADLQRVVDQASLRLLPSIAPGGDSEIEWLRNQRERLEELRLRLLGAAIAWAEHRSDPWARELRTAWNLLRPDQDPPRASSRPDPPPPPAEDVISNIGLADARELIGREPELSRLHRRFKAGKRIQVIWGEGGIGKSDLALTYLHLHAADYRMHWKVSAETDVELLTDLRRLGRALGIPSAESTSFYSDDADTERFISDLCEHLGSQAADSWLLFFDNVVDLVALGAVWRRLPANGHVLITSQLPDWQPPTYTDMPLWGLEPADAVKLMALASYRLETGSDDLAKICAALQFNPMLIKHAGMTMFKDGIGPTQYLDRLNSGIEQAVEMWPELDETGRHAITTYGLAIDRASLEAPGAKALVETVSFLAPEPINEAILYAGIVNAVPELADKDALVRSRRALRNRSLIQTYQRTEAFSVHRVVQAVVRLRLGSEEAKASRLAAAVDALVQSLPDRDAADANERRRPLVPHIEAVIAHVEPSKDPLLRSRTAELASQLGLFFHSQSEWEAAEAAHERAVELSRDDSDTRAAAMRSVRLAHVIRQRGRFDDAERAIASAMPALRDAAGADDVGLAYALTVQARILKEKPASVPLAARQYFEEALEILDHGNGERDHFDQLSRTLNYSAGLLRQLGEYREAEAQSRRGFELLTGTTPEDWMEADPSDEPPRRLVALHLRSLGNLWRLLGRFGEARAAHERALTIIRDLHEKEDHADVGRCLDSLGRVKREYGDFDDALDDFQQARRVSDRRFGQGHPHAATALTNVATVLREQGHLPEALEAIEEAVGIYRHNYGDSWADGAGELHNEHTAWAVFVRAEINVSRKDAAAADPDHRQVLRLRRKLYGSRDHPNLAASLQGLADIAALAERPKKAIALNLQAREMRIRVFGAEGNYWVAQSDARLGELLDDPGQRLSHLRAAEGAWSTQLAPSHPWLARIRKEIDESAGQRLSPSQ